MRRAESVEPAAELRQLPPMPPRRNARHVAFGLLSVWMLYQGTWGTTADSGVGDAGEYILMSDALVRHGTPDLRPGDTYNPEAEERLKNPPQGPRDFLLGFVGAPNGRWYCWHFFFYPILCLPMRGVVELVGLPALQAYTLTHAVLTICVVGQMLYATRYPLGLQLVGIVLYVWSSAFWYFAWPHSEVMTCAFVFMSLIAWFHERRYQAILLSSLAAMQNPPLFLLALFYLLPTLFRRVPNMACNAFLCGITSFWVIVPPLFYRYHFGVSSLIVDFGFLDRNQISMARFWGFFFDLDQGMILSLPTALPLFVFVYIVSLMGARRPLYNLLLVPLVICMTFFIVPMDNWNHGQAGINRYATWCSMIPLAFLIDLLNQGWNRNRLVAMALLVVAPQVVVIQHYGGTHVPRHAYLSHKEPALFMLEHYPRLYNPDPEIFIVRTTGGVCSTRPAPAQNQRPDLPDPDIIPFLGQGRQITKIAVRRGSERKLLNYGWHEDDVQRVTAGARYINGWAYVHPDN